MTRIPEEDHLSLNQVADICGMERQRFRKLVGEFEKRGGSLPKRTNEHNVVAKQIPSSFLHIFEEAALWMEVEDIDEGMAMARVFERGHRYQLQELARAITNTRPLLQLPVELKESAKALERAAKQPRLVSVNLADQEQLADALLEVNSRYHRWLFAGIFLLGLLAGSGGLYTLSYKQLQTQTQQIQGLQNRVTNLQKRLDTKLDRIEKQLRR